MFVTMVFRSGVKSEQKQGTPNINWPVLKACVYKKR